MPGRAAAFLWGYVVGVLVMALLLLGLAWLAIRVLEQAPPYCTRTPGYVGRGLRQCRPLVPKVYPPGLLQIGAQGVVTAYRVVYGTGMDSNRTQGGKAMQQRITEGTLVETTKDTTNYAAIPAGTRAIVRSIGPSHSTMNGGGRDCALELVNPRVAKAYATAAEARLRELQAADTTGYYTDSLVAHVAAYPMVNDNYLRAVPVCEWCGEASSPELGNVWDGMHIGCRATAQERGF